MPIALYPRMRICSFTFERMTSPVERPYGSGTSKYQGQSGPLSSGIWEEVEDELGQEKLHKGVQSGMALDGEEP
jgi:dCTP deaminase